jgi:hypothetical protein
MLLHRWAPPAHKVRWAMQLLERKRLMAAILGDRTGTLASQERSSARANLNRHAVCVCVFITAGPSTKLFTSVVQIGTGADFCHRYLCPA